MAAAASRVLAGILTVACAVVPALFTTSLDDVFTLPKLAALWFTLVAALAVLAIAALTAGWAVLSMVPVLAVDLSVAAFVVLNVGAFAASGDHHQSLFGERWQYQGFATTLLYVGFFALTRLAITSQHRLTLLFAGITTGATLVAACGLAQQAGFDLVFDRSTLPGGRVFATIGQANALAAYLLIAIPVAAALFLRCRSGRARVIVLVAIASMVASLAFTESRSGYLGLLIVLPIVVVSLARCSGLSWGRLARTIGVLVIVGGATVALVQPVRSAADDVWDRTISSFDLRTPTARACLSCAGPGDISIRRRLDFWMVAGQMALDHPLLGTGQETYPDRFPEYSHELLPADRVRFHDQFRVESPHNVPLAIAAGSGIPSLVAYLAIVASACIVMIRAARASRDQPTRAVFVLLLTAILGHLVTDMFMTAELTSTWLFWVLMGAGVAFAVREGGSAAQRRRSPAISKARSSDWRALRRGSHIVS